MRKICVLLLLLLTPDKCCRNNTQYILLPQSPVRALSSKEEQPQDMLSVAVTVDTK